MKLLFLDVETTGLSPYKHGIWQLAGRIYINKEKKEEFDLKCAPFEKDECNEQALHLNKITEADVRDFPSPPEVYKGFVKMLDKYVDRYNKQDKFFFIGYNARFDNDHLYQWFKKNGNNYCAAYYHFPPIDVMQAAMRTLMKQRPEMLNFKLATVARTLGIKVEEEKLHDAMYDIDITEQVYKKCGGIYAF